MATQSLCPIVQRGLLPRSSCDSCDGRPLSGQRTLARGDVVAAQGLPARHVYAVISGWLKECVYDEEGRAQVVRLHRAGDFAGLDALTSPTYLATLEALGQARVCEIPATVLTERLESPELAGPFARLLLGDLRHMRTRITALGALDGQARVLGLLEELTAGSPPGRWTRLPVTRTEMAEMLGLAQETVSRLIQRLARAGDLEVRGRWVRLPEPGARAKTPEEVGALARAAGIR